MPFIFLHKYSFNGVSYRLALVNQSIKMTSHFAGFQYFAIADNTSEHLYIHCIAREPAGSTTTGALLPEQEAVRTC